MAAHAALLMPATRGASDNAGTSSAVVSVRLQAAAPDVAVFAPAPTSEPPIADEPTASSAAEHATGPEPVADVEESEPVFADGLPAIGFPDAPLPGDSADVRAYVSFDAQGAATAVATSAPPQLPAGFQKMVEASLRQARLQASAPTSYCLLVRFDAAAPAPTLAWLPGAARDAARCLAGALPAPREIVVPETAAAP